MQRYITILGVLLCAVGCGKDISGTYKGPENGTQNGQSFSLTITMTINQVGDDITGTFLSSSGSSGTLTGKIDGDTITSFTAVAPTTDSCPGTFKGTATVKDDKMSGSFGGTAVCGTVAATFDLTKID